MTGVQTCALPICSNVTPFIVGGAAGDSWAAAWPLMDLVALNVTGKDENYLKDLRNGDRNFSDPLMADSINAYSSLVSSGWTNSTALSLNYSELQQTFLNQSLHFTPTRTFTFVLSTTD